MNKVLPLYIEERHYLSGQLLGSAVVECLTQDRDSLRLCVAFLSNVI